MVDDLLKLVGIGFLLYWSFRTLIINTIRAYKEIHLEILKSEEEITKRADEVKLENTYTR